MLVKTPCPQSCAAVPGPSSSLYVSPKDPVRVLIEMSLYMASTPYLIISSLFFLSDGSLRHLALLRCERKITCGSITWLINK